MNPTASGSWVFLMYWLGVFKDNGWLVFFVALLL